MRVILSRKGFDSKYGGCPSPIINGRPYSLPIPTGPERSVVKFRDLQIPGIPEDRGRDFIQSLTRGRVNGDQFCHLDPDIDRSVLKRIDGWKGAFGQVGASSTHLQKCGVTVGDIFLFFGWFREVISTERPKYIGRNEHRVFGWLQIGSIIDLGGDGSRFVNSYPWLKDHPHVRQGWDHVSSNTLYIASDDLVISGKSMGRAGSGVFLKGFTLTAAEADQRSIWRLPGFFDPTASGVGLSRHPLHRWIGGGLLNSVPIGQEFVADIGDREDAVEWLWNLFQEL